ncbi:MAG: PHP domain-containing protein, partial [Candidatus Eremiobacteraeota bacterium]|nr:PHP domain-containing protein [Candidatus Eremiobacteraeota bacterium]
MRPLGYAELHCWSNFTFLEGASHPEGLVEQARRLGLPALALTDRDGLYGAVRFAKAAKGTGLAALCGAELTLADGDRPSLARGEDMAALSARRPRLVLLAENEAGYANLVHLISIAQMRGSKRDALLHLADLDGKTEGLIALSSSGHGFAEEALLRGDATTAQTRAAQLRDLFGRRFFIELQHHLRPEDVRLILAQLEIASALQLPYVATNGVAYARKGDARICDVLRCVKYKTNLAAAGTLLFPNAEFHLKSAAQMSRLFAPYPRALQATQEIAERCTFRLERLAGQFPRFPIPDGETSTHSYLRTLVYAGARIRYGAQLDAAVERQLEYELGIIARMDLAGYFLVVWDISHKAEELGVLAQGRGSAANSAVCYALGITAVDPIRMNLLFERFLSEERNEVPDIDIDFAHQDREKVIQYVYERYGREHAAMTAEVVTYRTRSAIRDIGKALGLTLAQVDAIAKEYDARESLVSATGAEAASSDGALPDSVKKRRDLDAASNVRASRGYYPRGFENADDMSVLLEVSPRSNAVVNPKPEMRGPVGGAMGKILLELCRRIDGFPRHMGIHSGGMVLTRDPLVRVAPVEWATMKDRTIVQWDKDDLADLGLIKIDLLGLGMLSL